MEQTRGVAGFYCAEPMLIYQNENAEPENLGVKILGEFKGYGLGGNIDRFFESSFLELETISGAEPATGYYKQYFREHLPSELVRDDTATIYDLFTPLQGTLKPYLDGQISILPDESRFILDSRFCKWGYVLNLANRSFEILRGDQFKSRDGEPPYNIGEDQRMSVYHDRSEHDYPCSIVQAYDISNLPSEEQFLKDLERFK